MFRELDKVNTDISGSWLRAALLVSYVSIAITLILGTVYFGGYLYFYYTGKSPMLLIFHFMSFRTIKMNRFYNQLVYLVDSFGNVW